MEILGLDPRLFNIVVVALICGAIFFSVGVRNPGHGDSYRWRQIWSIADILAVTVTIVGVAKLMSPLLSMEQSQIDVAKRNIGIGKQESAIYAINRAQDKFCPVEGVSTEAVATCDVIRRMQRSLYAPRANHVTAGVILQSDLPVICTENQCDPVIADIKRTIIDFQAHSLSVREIVDDTHPATEKDIIYLLIFTGMYVFIASFRLGRSGAEFSRNRLDYQAKNAKLKTPEPKDEQRTVEQQLKSLSERVSAIESGAHPGTAGQVEQASS
ncbi:hypothetical protein IM543_03905 [Massilia sp. UMI-21]|nr:hypothetical protein IM543_03905 [Massilia sp. UMI-21]